MRQLRIAAGLSQEALAERAKISIAAVSSYERGIIAAPHRETAALIAKALHLSEESRAEFDRAARPKPRLRRVLEPDMVVTPQHRNLTLESKLLVGRDLELDEISAALQKHAVVTVTGTGGVGKTRVASSVALRRETLHVDGVWFVDLASIQDSTRVVAKIVAALPIPFALREETPEILAEAMRTHDLLLVLDNCEHVLEAVSAVASAIAKIAPAISILATSRHRLGIRSEFVYRLSPLIVPDTDPATAAEALQFSAVALFVTRASVADRHFTLTDDRVAAVAEICRRVEGIPLSLELAAARLPMFGLTSLMQQLTDRLGPLKGDVRDMPARQQTLRATIDWSYELLTIPERLLLQRLAIFSGGCVLSAAEDVCSDEDLPEADIPDVLGCLVDRSLVVATTHGHSLRYNILESTRQYAYEKLEVLAREKISDRHALWSAAFADDVEAATFDLTDDEWVQNVVPEVENIYQAISWTSGPGHQPTLFCRIVGGMCFLWVRNGRFEEGRRLATQALAALGSDTEPHIVAQLHLVRSLPLSGWEKIDAIQLSVALLDGFGDKPARAKAYCLLAAAYLVVDDRDRLEATGHRLLELIESSPALGSLRPWSMMFSAGVCLLDERIHEARDELHLALQEPLVTDRLVGSYVLMDLAHLEYELGNVERAANICHDLGASMHRRQSIALAVLAQVRGAAYQLLLGRLEHSEALAREGLAAARGSNATLVACAIQILGAISGSRGDTARAARLKGYADLRFTRDEQNGFRIPIACRDILQSLIEQNLPQTTRDRHLARGARLTEDMAIADALTSVSKYELP